MPATALRLACLAATALLVACSEPQPPAAGAPAAEGGAQQPAEPGAQQPADIVMRGGYVYTADAGRQVAEAVAIRGDRIVAVGSSASMEPLIAQGTAVLELAGRMVMPGIHDTHVHAMGTIEPDMCDFRGQPKSLEEMVPFLKDCLARYAKQPGDWLIALQWPFAQGNQPSERYPTLRAALDAVSTEHPIVLAGDDGHHGAANSAALAQARDAAGNVVGLNRETLATVFAGYRPYVAVDANGEPSGGLNEGARMVVRPTLFQDFLGAGADPADTMPRVAAVLASRGITSIQDPAVAPESLPAYKWLEDSGQMTFRMRAGLFSAPVDSMSEGGTAQIPAMLQGFKALREQYAGSRLIRVDGVKLFADAVLEGNPLTEPPTLPGAAVLGGFHQPMFRMQEGPVRVEVTGYVDLDGPACTAVRAAPADYEGAAAIAAFRSANGFLPAQCTKSSGVLEHSEAFIREYVRQATEAGFNVHIHALSDKGVRAAVDAFEQAKPAADRQGLTQSLAHLQLVHPEEQKRIGALGIYNTFTYAWIVPEPNYNLLVIPFIERVKDAASMFDPATYYMQNVYPVKAIREAGGILTWGSDAPVESRDPRPFQNLEQAVTRAWDGQALNAANAIDIHEALAAFTINGARMLGTADLTGSIEPGKLADLVVLDRNPVELATGGRAEEISDTKVLVTVFEGKVVYQAEGG